MALTPGLVGNLRQVAPESDMDAPEPNDIIIEVSDDDQDTPEFDQNGNILKIEHADGSISISLDGRPIQEASKKLGKEWFDNLVDEIDESELNRIASDILRGVQDDIHSRKDWVEDRALGLKLLGLKLEVPGLGGSAEGAPVEGMSRVRHPLLLEAVLRFQANARSELLPTDGPVKIRNDNNNALLQEDQLANALERDLNHYLTVTASEYYPDTDRMIFMLGFGGTAFKKIYFCPLRNRPVSETVDADDVIVNNSATDLNNARRITHRTYMRPSTVRRLQILGVYKDVDLPNPSPAKLDSVQREKNAQQGIQDESLNPEDRDREIYECYCELNIRGFEHTWKGKESGLDIPYRVTLDVSSHKILSIVRNYDEDTEQLPEARNNFVKYTFVPGLGFYDIGLLHILGNTTNAVTAAWRELLDAGMYSNFPGFLMSDTGARQNTNIFRVPPGGGALVKTGGMPINQAIMALPYKEPSAALMNLVDNIVATGQRLGGTSEQAVGEGVSETPVGTTLASIEQATKIMNSVHKRMHAAQAEEFRLLVECFKEHPDSFWQRNRKPSLKWDENTFLQALNDCELTPQADPNTASHTQRLMKVAALKQLQAGNPSMYDPIAIDIAALQVIGWGNPQQFMAPASAQANPPPELLQIQSKMATDKQDANSRAIVAHARAAELQAKANAPQGQQQQDPAQQSILQQQNALKAQEIKQKQEEMLLEATNRKRDRESAERLAAIKYAEDMAKDPSGYHLARSILQPGMLDRLEENETPIIPGSMQPIE